MNDADKLMKLVEQYGAAHCMYLACPSAINEEVRKEALQEVVEHYTRIVRQRDRLLFAINDAIITANGRETEWGDRAEQCFAILEREVRQ